MDCRVLVDTGFEQEELAPESKFLRYVKPTDQLQRLGLAPDEITDVVKTVMDREGELALQYGPTEGDGRLIEYLVNWMREEEGADIDQENILIVSGSQQALAKKGRKNSQAGRDGIQAERAQDQIKAPEL